MIIHPVRMNGMVIGVAQTYEYFERIQDRFLLLLLEILKLKDDLKT